MYFEGRSDSALIIKKSVSATLFSSQGPGPPVMRRSVTTLLLRAERQLDLLAGLNEAPPENLLEDPNEARDAPDSPDIKSIVEHCDGQALIIAGDMLLALIDNDISKDKYRELVESLTDIQSETRFLQG